MTSFAMLWAGHVTAAIDVVLLEWFRPVDPSGTNSR